MGLPFAREILAAREPADDLSDLYEKRSERLTPILWRLGAALVLTATVVGSIGIMTYHPLTAAQHTQPSVVTGARSESTEPATFTAVFEPGASFEYSFSFANAGRWGVTVTGLEAPAHATFEDVTIDALAPGSATNSRGSFALRPGASASFRVRVTFASCKTPPPTGARAVWSSEVVTYRVAGVTLDQDVALPYRIVVDDAAAPSC